MMLELELEFLLCVFNILLNTMASCFIALSFDYEMQHCSVKLTLSWCEDKKSKLDSRNSPISLQFCTGLNMRCNKTVFMNNF